MFLLPIKKLQTAGQQIKTRLDGSGTLVYKYWVQTKQSSINLKPKAFEDVYLSPGAERRGASSTTTGSSTLTNALRSNQNISELPPIADRQEEKINFLLFQGMEDDDTFFS